MFHAWSFVCHNHLVILIQATNKVIRMPASTDFIEKYRDIMQQLHPRNKYAAYPGAGLRKDVVPPKKFIDAARTLFER